MVGLGDVDNTSDAAKFSSPTFTGTATVPTLNATTALQVNGTSIASIYAPLANPTFTGTVSGITKSMVGLGNVDNTSDATKFASPTFTGTATVPTLNATTALQINGTSIASIYAPLANPTFTGTVSGVTKAHVGLGNVDNTSDASKPVSTLTQAALDLKAPLASPAFTGTVTGITKAMVGLSNVDNTSDATKFANTPLTGVTTAATVNASTALQVGGTNISSIYAPLANPTFTGTATAATLNATTISGTNINAATGLSVGGVNISTIYAPKAAPTFTGTTTADVLKVDNISEQITSVGITSNTVTLSYSNTSVYSVTAIPTANLTAAITNLPSLTDATSSFIVSVMYLSTAAGYFVNTVTVNGSAITPKYAVAPSGGTVAGNVILQQFVFTYQNIGGTTALRCFASLTNYAN